MPLSEFQNGYDEDPDLFILTEQAAAIFENPRFLELYASFEGMAEEEETKGEVGEDLDAEDDEYGNVEYKYYMCKLSTLKTYKRMTQMKWRLEVSDITLFHNIDVYCSKAEGQLSTKSVCMTMVKWLALTQKKSLRLCSTCSTWQKSWVRHLKYQKLDLDSRRATASN